MSFIPQWNQYTAYAVGSVVQLNLTTYICILATPPSATPPASAPLVWTATASSALPNGLVDYATLSWTPVGVIGYSAPITGVSPLLTATSQISATIQVAPSTGADLSLAAGAWLIGAQPTTAANGTITFWVSNGEDPRTAVAGKTFIEWAVVKF